MVIVVGFVLLVVVASICSSSDTNDQLPVYTPTPADIDAAFAKGIADIEEALESFDEIYPTAIRDLNAVSKVVDDALREAMSCRVHIDALANDPREAGFAGNSWLAHRDLGAVRDAPLAVAGDLAAAYAASPANRDLIDDANSEAYGAHLRANMKNGKYISPGYYYTDDPDLDPVLKTYWAYYSDNPAKNTYTASIDEINEAYFPVADDILEPARDDLITAFMVAPTTKDCQELLLWVHEEYMHAYDVHYPAFLAYFADLKSALEAYATALRDERRRYASSR